jgi:hypothetical protein
MPQRWYLRAAAAALALSALTFAAGLAGFFRISHARTTSLRDWNDRRCSGYRSTHAGADDPCREVSRDGPTLISHLKDARIDISRAKVALYAGDEATAAHALATALDRATVAERRSSLFATAIAARITAEVLDVVDESPAVARRTELASALARTKLPTALRPLEADRLRIAHVGTTERWSPSAFLTWGASDARTADAVEREDALMHSMQLAARAGDQAACERAGAKASIGPHVCASLVRTTTTAKRLAARSARSRSLAADERLDLRSR